MHVIGMLKDNKQKYRYNGKSLGLKDLANTFISTVSATSSVLIFSLLFCYL